VNTIVSPRPAPAEAPDDAALVERARAGDRPALDVLLTRHLDAVYDLAFRLLGDRDLAQDAAQDAFVNAVRGLQRFRGEASFRTWLLRIAANAARSHARRRGRRREVGISALWDRPGDAPDPAERAAMRSEAERVERAIAALPEKQRLAVTLRLYQGLDYAAVATIIGSTEGAARVNYHHGIKRLREMLQ